MSEEHKKTPPQERSAASIGRDIEQYIQDLNTAPEPQLIQKIQHLQAALTYVDTRLSSYASNPDKEVDDTYIGFLSLKQKLEEKLAEGKNRLEIIDANKPPSISEVLQAFMEAKGIVGSEVFQNAVARYESKQEKLANDRLNQAVEQAVTLAKNEASVEILGVRRALNEEIIRNNKLQERVDELENNPLSKPAKFDDDNRPDLDNEDDSDTDADDDVDAEGLDVEALGVKPEDYAFLKKVSEKETGKITQEDMDEANKIFKKMGEYARNPKIKLIDSLISFFGKHILIRVPKLRLELVAKRRLKDLVKTAIKVIDDNRKEIKELVEEEIATEVESKLIAGGIKATLSVILNTYSYTGNDFAVIEINDLPKSDEVENRHGETVKASPRTDLEAQVLFMAEELGLVENAGFLAKMDEKKRGELRRKTAKLKEFSKKHKADVRAYFEETLGALTDAFPELKIEEDDEEEPTLPPLPPAPKAPIGSAPQPTKAEDKAKSQDLTTEGLITELATDLELTDEEKVDIRKGDSLYDDVDLTGVVKRFPNPTFELFKKDETVRGIVLAGLGNKDQKVREKALAYINTARAAK